MLKQFSLCLVSLVFSSCVCCENLTNWQDDCKANICEAIIDAGSSGSRLYVYSKRHTSWQVVYNQRLSPGLSSVNVADVGSYLDNLVQIHPAKKMPIALYGTAGMRLLSPEQQTQRYQAVVSWFNQHPEWTLKQARTITGQEEGVFAWLAVQEEMGLLNKPLENLNSVVEIGGASAQVSIPVSEKEAKMLPASDIYPIKWDQKTIYVWSKSFLGLGLNEVENNFANSNACFSYGYPLKNGLYGQGDMSVCVNHLEQQKDLELIQKLNQAKEVLKQNPETNWVALGAIRFSASKPPYRFSAQQFNLKELKQQGDEEICHKDWQLLSRVIPDDPYLYRGCLAASYFYASLSNGIGISDSTNIYYPDTNSQMDWTLGVLLLG